MNKMILAIVTVVFLGMLVACSHGTRNPAASDDGAGGSAVVNSDGHIRLLDLQKDGNGGDFRIEELRRKAIQVGLPDLEKWPNFRRGELSPEILRFLTYAVEDYSVASKNPDAFSAPIHEILAELIPKILITEQMLPQKEGRTMLTFGDRRSLEIKISPEYLARMDEIGYKQVVLHSYLSLKGYDRAFEESKAIEKIIKSENPGSHAKGKELTVNAVDWYCLKALDEASMRRMLVIYERLSPEQAEKQVAAFRLQCQEAKEAQKR